MSSVRVFFHDKCFDGSTSAAVFTAFYHACIAPTAQFDYHGVSHKVGELFAPEDFAGQENAIVDFKYSSDPRVTWWFDHHQSAFLTPADAAHFRQDRGGKKFYDPHYRSCTAFIAHIARTRFDFDPAPLAELIQWADIVDGALFESAQAAVELRSPALQLTLAVEGAKIPGFIPRLIHDYQHLSLRQILDQDYVQAGLQPLLARHRQAIDLLSGLLECRDGVISFDLTAHAIDGYNKFIPYYLCPKGIYSVGISRGSFRTKVSVGSNPWQPSEHMVNLADLCERYGGGGHPRVGAISFPPGEVEAARQAAAEITAELRQAAARIR